MTAHAQQQKFPLGLIVITPNALGLRVERDLYFQPSSLEKIKARHP
jgi:hypothetical protein